MGHILANTSINPYLHLVLRLMKKEFKEKMNEVVLSGISGPEHVMK
jgi:hypothetical protein